MVRRLYRTARVGGFKSVACTHRRSVHDRAMRALVSVILLLLASSCGSASSPSASNDDTEDTATTDSATADVAVNDAVDSALVEVDTSHEPDATDSGVQSGPIGWASVEGYGVPTTIGGGDAAPVTVTTLAELNDNARGTAPRVIHVSGSISGRIVIGSNKTIVGLAGASLRGTLGLSGSVNVIVKNLTIVGYNCTDNTDCGSGADAINVGSNAHHLWFDHLDVSDGSDGNLDITRGADLVTVSWTKFHYSEARAPTSSGHPHRFSNLVGANDDSPEDIGRLRVTFHHVWWADRVAERMPRVRYGRVHVFNSLYTAVNNNACVGAGFFANILLENNAFYGVNNPIRLSNSNESTIVVSKGNLYESVTGSTADKGGPAFEPPYPYELDPVSTVRTIVTSGTGPK
jgi:pectate lyase